VPPLMSQHFAHPAFRHVYGETLRPTYALHDFQPSDLWREWILVIEAVCFEAVY